jgi:hypothetical protein
MTYDNRSAVTLITWGIKAIALDSNVLITPNALVIMKEAKLTAYGARDASSEKTNVMAPETSVIAKDVAWRAQEAKMVEKWDKMLKVYEEKRTAAW